MTESLSKNSSYGIMEDELEVFMTLLLNQLSKKNFLILFTLAVLFSVHDAFLYFLYYKIGFFIWKALDREWFNRIGFGAFCTISLMAICYLIHQG